jgi:hypothetical protein
MVAKAVGINTHNHVDVPLTAADMPGPDIDLSDEMKRSGLSAICRRLRPTTKPAMRTSAFLDGLASMDRQLEPSSMKRSLTRADVRIAHKNG